MRQQLIVDADDTLWENNIYFERAFDEFIDFLAHSSLQPREVRAILWDYPIAEDEQPRRVRIEDVAKDNGIPCPILELNRLIERVYVAPKSSPDLEARVRVAMDREKVTAPLLRSSLETPAVY